MMLGYVLRLIVMLVLVSGLAVLALWLYRRLQPGMSFGARERALKVVDAVPMGAMARIAVVEFSGRRYLVGVSRGRMDLIGEGPIPDAGDDA